MFLCASVKKNLCECISLTQRAQSYRDAEFYGSHRMHRTHRIFILLRCRLHSEWRTQV